MVLYVLPGYTVYLLVPECELYSVKTADPLPTTGRATPPGGVGVDRRREIYRIVAASLREDHFSGPVLKKKWVSPIYWHVVIAHCFQNVIINNLYSISISTVSQYVSVS